MWADAAALGESTLALLHSRVRLLLRRRMAIGSVVHSAGHAHAYGLTVFVRKGAIEGLLSRDIPQIGAEVLLNHSDVSGTILDTDGIGRGNASSSGLDLLVVSTHVRHDSGRFDDALGHLMKAFQDDHQGYRLSMIASEFFGDSYIAAALANRGYTVRRVFDDVGGRPGLRSLVGTVTREEAKAGTMGLFLPMFVYSPPVIRFTEAERELLRIAISGGTDEWMSSHLGLSLSAVKARWIRIQERAMRRLPELFAGSPAASRPGRRGAQTRHILLHYVRRMPCELTPYDPRFESAAGNARIEPAALSIPVQSTASRRFPGH
jgi:hypothetical protein